MKRRDQIRMTDDELDDFLQAPRTMNVASIGPDGRVHLVAMWYAFHEGHPAFTTYGKSQKVRNIRRNPAITCLVESGDRYDELKGVELVGTARIIEDREQVQAIGASVRDRYDPRPAVAGPPIEVISAKRVGVVIDVEQAVSWDHSKISGY